MNSDMDALLDDRNDLTEIRRRLAALIDAATVKPVGIVAGASTRTSSHPSDKAHPTEGSSVNHEDV